MAKHYDDDYEGVSFEKFSNHKNKKHKKGHQSRSSNSERWKLYELETLASMEEVETPSCSPLLEIKTTKLEATVKNEHQFGSNTHEIKGVKIDFDGVDNITKVDNQQNGVMTHGIKFYFKGKKGLYRIIWYNTNLRARDAAYNTEYAFWLSIKK